MKLIPTKCPQCASTLDIHPNTDHCKCSYCGSKFVVDWERSGNPNLTNFEALLSKVISQSDFLAADRRLVYIEKNTENEWNNFSLQIDSLINAQEKHKDLQLLCSTEINRLVNWLSATAILATLFGITAFFVYRTLFAILFILFALTSIGIYLYKENLANSLIPEKLSITELAIKGEEEKIDAIEFV